MKVQWDSAVLKPTIIFLIRIYQTPHIFIENKAKPDILVCVCVTLEQEWIILEWLVQTSWIRVKQQHCVLDITFNKKLKMKET